MNDFEEGFRQGEAWAAAASAEAVRRVVSAFEASPDDSAVAIERDAEGWWRSVSAGDQTAFRSAEHARGFTGGVLNASPARS